MGGGGGSIQQISVRLKGIQMHAYGSRAPTKFGTKVLWLSATAINPVYQDATILANKTALRQKLKNIDSRIKSVEFHLYLL